MAKTDRKLRLVLSGYYGFRNSGDEAVLLSILNALEQAGEDQGVFVEPIVLSGDPAWTARQYGVWSVPRMKLREVREAIAASDGVISGGGSLLQDATGLGSIPYYLGILEMARWARKPTFVYAQGIGPVKRRMFGPFIARAMRKASYVSVRDAESAALLAGFGVPEDRVAVVPDPVMGLPLPPSAGGAEVRGAAAGGAAGDGGRAAEGRSAASGEPGAAGGAWGSGLAGAAAAGAAGDGPRAADGARGSGLAGAAAAGAGERDAAPAEGAGAARGGGTDRPPLVGVSVRFWRGDRSDLDRIAAALAALARQRPVRLRFLPFHEGADEDASRYVIERLGDATVMAEIAPAHDAPQEMLREIDRCDLLVGMRLHSLIYAANREVPLLGLSYDPKIDQFLHRLGDRPIGTVDAIDVQHFAAKAVQFIEDPAQWRIDHYSAIRRLKEEAALPAQRIVEACLELRGR
ncbi:polysaccharide pyruvyl transferase family protein [Cohnella ginsengisoli]|uniref:Polysaccharide pyruvyl transferase family protein n=2 Tax=Cohnella ginsengisoli TaxID=425004 RepID=A0A9X4QQE4_9BACL|nr:polysaccharide pyruvyl transferase family protein [Cohnella ginsengisoli]MDG0794512.1 polysaccharide pyruvyl transferase family protein [Cohnella ginsengisoli]